MKPVPKEETRKQVPYEVLIDPDVNDFLIAHMEGRGSVGHIINAVLRMYRDELPVAQRGALAGATPIDQKKTTAPTPKKEAVNA